MTFGDSENLGETVGRSCIDCFVGRTKRPLVVMYSNVNNRGTNSITDRVKMSRLKTT